jgi:hypothetical protein
MKLKKIALYFTMIALVLISSFTFTVQSFGSNLPEWNKSWRYKEEIILPITTSSSASIFQPIDLYIEFTNPCWAKNEDEHSVRIVCYDGNEWIELESQIYKLEFKDSIYLKSCRIVFLIPEFANGLERYFIYYDNEEKPNPKYIDHVSIKDAYYYYAPISGVEAEGDYYKIEEDGHCVYGVGQKGKIMQRYLSQAVIKMKPDTKDFDVSDSENIASFCFAYNDGPNDDDQVSSDQVLISKDILVDGNLMVEFSLISESKNKNLRTSNVYQYYYSPTDTKRIMIHIKHEVLKESIVKGQENVNGFFGALFSFQSRSAKIQRMRFGEILPYVHVSIKNNKIKEYILDTNPTNKNREWIVSYSDNCVLGENSWLSYSEGESGKAFGILFSSYKNIVKSGTGERDGIQVTVVEKEYLKVLGSEIDYAAICFGRNSYEKESGLNLIIPGDLVVEFDVEFFTSYENGVKDVIEEYDYFKELVKYRQSVRDINGEGQGIITLTVSPRLTTRFFSYPLFEKLTGLTISKIEGEIYQDGKLVSNGLIFKRFFGLPTIKFTKLKPGDYVIKIYRQLLNSERRVIGLKHVQLFNDTQLKIFCTFEKTIKINVKNQNNLNVEKVQIRIYEKDFLIDENVTSGPDDSIISYPAYFNNPYVIKAYFKGFKIYEGKIPFFENKLNIDVKLYNIYLDVKDKLNFIPDVNIRPTLTSSEMNEPIIINAEDIGNGKFAFKNLLPAKYNLQISYGTFIDKKEVIIDENDCKIKMDFTALYNLNIKIFDLRGNLIDGEDIKIDLFRDNNIIFNSISLKESIKIPPGEYNVNVFLNKVFIGTKSVNLVNDKNINIVTEQEPLLPILVSGIILVFIIEILALLMFKKISLNTFLKLFAISLIILSLFQPWWSLNAFNKDLNLEKTSEMFILPQTMIESIKHEGITYREIAILPEIFTNFIGTLLLIIFSGIGLLIISFIPNFFLKKRLTWILISASTLFLILVLCAYLFGMSQIAGLSLGSLYGASNIDVVLPNEETALMFANWGLSFGFYLCIFAICILILTGVLDLIIKKKLIFLNFK